VVCCNAEEIYDPPLDAIDIDQLLRRRLAHMDCICFDVDSTVAVGEGIDDLAEHCGVLDEVRRLTTSAVNSPALLLSPPRETFLDAAPRKRFCLGMLHRSS
jgi:phosphoserine phosphatase